jgi:hypothetical protein
MSNILEAVGGRKFLMAIFIAIAGIVIEVYGKNGLSVNMAGLLATIYATFSASNTLITNKQVPKVGEEEPSVGLKLDDLKPAFNGIDQAYQALQSEQVKQAQIINVLQKAVLGSNIK